jgi:hypothetical protein
MMQQIKSFVAGQGPPPNYVSQRSFAEQSADADKERQFAELVDAIIDRAKKFSSNEEFWKKLIDLIEQAKQATTQKEWISAERYVTEASVLVNRAIQSESLKGVRMRLALAPLLWVLVLFLFQRLIEYLHSDFPTVYLISPAYFQYLWLGMLGGTTIVWWGIVKHATDLTFDPSFVIWYLLKPALGAVMGIVLVLAVQAGFLTLGGAPNIPNQIPLMVLAFIGGFSERFFVSMIDKLVTTLLGGVGGSTSTTSQPAPARPAPPKPPDSRPK